MVNKSYISGQRALGKLKTRVRQVLKKAQLTGSNVSRVT